MNQKDFLTYSAAEPMTVLRKRFHNGESLYKPVPDTISSEEALVDVSYLRYVMERAYSGYSFYDKALFDDAFSSIERAIRTCDKNIGVNFLVDTVADNFFFICDGHLSLTTETYGRGFYRKMQTYVTDMLLRKESGNYVCAESGETVEIGDNIAVFPTIPNDGEDRFLVGVRSKDAVAEIKLTIAFREKTFPVHKIASKGNTEEKLVEEVYLDDIAIISSSSFVGDTESYSDVFFELGEKCRKYKHVILDLSNNLGGNSALPEQFLKGLNGWCIDSSKIYELRSTLVHAKECGDIKEIPYHLEFQRTSAARQESLFTGTLHVIINDRVASSAESAVIMAKSLEKVRFYGCNSMGIGRFGDLCIYYLPYSQITLWCPQKVFDNTIEETVGYAPDIWIDSNNVLPEVIRYIQQAE